MSERDYVYRVILQFESGKKLPLGHYEPDFGVSDASDPNFGYFVFEHKDVAEEAGKAAMENYAYCSGYEIEKVQVRKLDL